MKRLLLIEEDAETAIWHRHEDEVRKIALV